jgi:amidase
VATLRRVSATDPALWTTTAQAEAIRRKQLSSTELLGAQLTRIERMNGQINAVCTTAFEAAEQRASEADAACARGESWGPLHGIPVTIKDAIATAGIRSTGGSSALIDHVPADDAPAVAAVKAAGAIVIGKTNVPEWSGDLQTFNDMFGTTNNPWDLARVPGGSSGGAAAAVACGMSSFEVGTDIGGSVRVPSAFCGVFGHKPSFGVISTLGYLDEPSGGVTESDINVFGPIARSIDDLVLLLGILAGARDERATAWELRLPPSEVDDLRALRVATWFDEPSIRMHAEMVAILDAAADRLTEHGVKVDRNARPDIDFTEAWQDGDWLIEAATHISDMQRRLHHTDWLVKDRLRARRRVAWRDFFEHVDVLLCPITVVPPFRHQHEGTWSSRTMIIDGKVVPYGTLGSWPALIGSVYLPATAVPIGRTKDRLPVGMQVVAPYLHDLRALRVAGLITEMLGDSAGYHVPPIAR